MKALVKLSAIEVNGDANTLDYSHVHKVKHIEMGVSTEKLVLREPNTALVLYVFQF